MSEKQINQGGRLSAGKKASEEVFENLEARILGGEFQPNEKLPSERTLMKVYGRSHPTIREALRQLETAGYIAVIPGGGAVVTEFHLRDIEEPLEELVQFRKLSSDDLHAFLFAAAPVAARFAAVRRTWEDIAALEETLETLRRLAAYQEAAPGSHEEQELLASFFNTLRSFNVLIAKATHNPLILVLWNAIFRMIDIDKAEAFVMPECRESLEQILRFSAEVVQAIRNQEEDEASQMLSRTFDYMYHVVGIRFKTIYEWSGVPDNSMKASEQIYHDIRWKILNRELKAGERLPSERRLVEEFGKSRAAIREAFRMLEQKNYLTIRRGSGAFVNDVSMKEVERALDSMLRYRLITTDNIMEVRDITETIAAEWAAERHTEADLEVIRDALERSRHYLDDFPKLLAAGTDFTNGIVQAAHNQALEIVCHMTQTFIHDRYRDLTGQELLDTALLVIRQHTRILYEIEKGEAAGAREATLVHLGTVRNTMDRRSGTGENGR